MAYGNNVLNGFGADELIDDDRSSNNLASYLSDQEALREFYAWSIKQWDKNGGPNESGRPFYEAELIRLRDTEERIIELRAELEAGGTFESWLAKKEGQNP